MRRVADRTPTTTLHAALRAEGLTGTKEGCAEGDCGACTVMVARPRGGRLDRRAVNACIMPLAMVHGAAVTTVEGLGGDHPVQREMVTRHASQCGFCTPGFVMSLAARPVGAPADRQALEDRLAGNLCRCTGYGPIVEAGTAAAADADALADEAADAALAAELGAIGPLDMSVAGQRAIAPREEAGFAAAVAEHPDATIISGATDVGLWITKRLFMPETAIFAGEVDALRTIAVEGDRLVVGAAVTNQALADAVAPHSAELAELLRRFGGLQVRNAGTVGGNIANGSPIGDLPPALIAAGATLTLGHADGARSMALEAFFVDYGRQDRRPGEYVRHVSVPLAGLRALSCHKVSKRFDSDITAVLGCFMVRVVDGRVAEARLAFGGMAGTPKRALAAEAALLEAPYTEAAVSEAARALEDDFSPLTDLRASAAYRLAVARNLLRRDFIERTQPGVATRLAGAAGAEVAA